VEFEFGWLVVAALMVLASVFAHLVSRRFGAPILLVFLLLGMLAGEDGPVGIEFSDAKVAFLVGSMALAVILFDGGMRTPMAAVRVAWGPALVLATVGVIVTAGVVAGFLMIVFDVEWRRAMLVGSVVASTDAAAVFSLLGQHGIGLSDRLKATLEVESGANDPMGIFLTIVFVEMLRLDNAVLGWGVLGHFVQQMGLGGAIGVAGGFAMVWLANRLELTGGLYPILAFAMALLIFSATQTIGGSGFLAVYAAGIVFGNRRVRAQQLTGRFFDGLTWLGQIGLFLMLGLLVTPSQLAAEAPRAIVAALALIVLARPLAVLVSLSPFGFSLREQLFIAWVGLRGAVPIFLALLPFMAGLDPDRGLFKVAFVVVLVSLLVQGWTIPFVANLLRVALPPAPEPAPRFDVDLMHTLDRDLVAYEVKPHSRATDWALADLDLPERVWIISVLRGDQVLAPDTLQKLEAADIALVLTPPEHSLAVDRWFSARFASTVAELPEGSGDFVVEGDHTLRQVSVIYGLALPGIDLDQTIDAFVHASAGGTPGRGDRVKLGEVELVVLDVIGDEVTRVGLNLDPTPRGWRGLVAKFKR
jgi:cell volume regulation protein A